MGFLLLCPLAAAARGETRHVLVVSSSERPYAPQSGFAEAFVRDLVLSSREPIDFVEVSIQAARASGETPDASTAERIRVASASRPLDLVVTIGGTAATFAQHYRAELFPSVPVLIAGVDRRFVERGTFADNETTVSIRHDPALMIDEILRLLPETRSVMIVVGASQLEQFWLQEMKRDFARFGSRLQFTFTNELSFAEIIERCRTMPAQSAIFFAILAVDGKGEPRIEGDTLQSLHASANAPIFSLYGMGRGVVGGPLLSTDELSRTTTEVALRLLAGESPASVKAPIQERGQPTYDARELRRWRINESRLPVASIVLFRESTLWERYRRPIGLTGLLGMPFIAIAVIVWRGRRRRAAIGALGATDVPSRTATDASVSVWTAQADGRRVQAGQGGDAADRDGWMSQVHPDDVERCREIYRRAFETREPFQMEYRVSEAGDMERWILDTGLPQFSGEHFDGFVGSAVDITSLGRARAELSNLSRHLMQSREHERALLARTLHEDVCQRMMALTLQLHHLKAAAQDHDVQVVVADVSEKLGDLVRQIAAMPDQAHLTLELLGLVVAGRRFCDDLSAQHDIPIEYRVEGVPADLPFDIGLVLFRVLQEATINAVVHSGAREIRVSIRGAAAEIRLLVVDDGIGFDADRAVPGGGVGLVAIRERLTLINGDSVVVSRPGEGTRVEAWVPLPRRTLNFQREARHSH